MTAFVRFADSNGTAGGVLGNDGYVRALGATLAELWRLPLDQLHFVVDSAVKQPGVAMDNVTLLAPIDGRTSLWGAGVTYRQSRDARVEESDTADVYQLAYSASRPELFFKAQSFEVVTNGHPVGIRQDSTNDTPEPELGVVVNALGEIIGYTTVNDMSSRSIEGENPLYLPQAKIYAASAVVAPTVRVSWEVPDPNNLMVYLSITRNGEEVFGGSTSTSDMARTLEELLDWLHHCSFFPDGVVLSTGTGLVPPLDTPTLAGDEITININGIASTTNVATPVSALLPWWRSYLSSQKVQPQCHEAI